MHRHYSKVGYIATMFIIGIVVTRVHSGLADELILGEKTISPGITLIFEGAIKDVITPQSQHLAKEKTDAHLEARVNWSEDPKVSVPNGTPRGGFVAYMHINAQVTNERTGKSILVTLLPHINLIDNLHYARNIALPGEKGDSYTVTFFIDPPEQFTLAFHQDWTKQYGLKLFEPHIFTFSGINFAHIVERER